MSELKLISAKDVAQALDLAAQYRLHREDSVAESICHDVLTQNAANQVALEMLLRIYASAIELGDKTALMDARSILARIKDPSTQAFCNALVYEAQALRLTARRDPPAAEAARELFGFALEQFDAAARATDPPLEAHLRANACCRAMADCQETDPAQQQEHSIE